MGKFTRPLAMGLLTFLLASCSTSLEDQQGDLFSYASRHQIGGSTDYYLVKSGLAGPDRVALIFGMAPDIDFCMELARMYMQQYPADRYTCEAAN